MATKYRVYSLDVWGHGPEEHADYDCDGECDGYTVNDRSLNGTIEVPGDDPDSHAIFDRLMGEGYFQRSVVFEDLKFDGDDMLIFVDAASDGEPQYQLERV